MLYHTGKVCENSDYTVETVMHWLNV